MATHFSVLAWKVPGTGEPGGLPSMGSHIFGHDWSDLAVAAAEFRNPVFFHHNRTSLMKLRGFITPNLRITKINGGFILSYFNIKQYKVWGVFYFLLHLFLLIKNSAVEHLFGVLKHYRVLCLTIRFLFVDTSENSF